MQAAEAERERPGSWGIKLEDITNHARNCGVDEGELGHSEAGEIRIKQIYCTNLE